MCEQVGFLLRRSHINALQCTETNLQGSDSLAHSALVSGKLVSLNSITLNWNSPCGVTNVVSQSSQLSRIPRESHALKQNLTLSLTTPLNSRINLSVSKYKSRTKAAIS